MPEFADERARNGAEPSLDDIRRADSFIEALANGGPVAPQDHADAALAALLGGWRDEARWPSDAGLISDADAAAALKAGLSEKPGRVRPDRPDTVSRNRRGLSVVGATAAAALALGGFGAVVSGAGPGDSLYGLRTMLFGASKEVRDEKVALAARTELQQVQELITQGDWQQAQEKLVAVSTQVAAVGNEEQKQELLTQFNDLSAKVVERDPAATAPPGVVYTVPPSAAELVPALAPPSTSTTETSADASTTSATTPDTSAATSGTSGTSTTAGTSGTSSTSAASATETSPATTSPVTTSPVTTSPTAGSAATTSATTSAPAAATSPPAAATSAPAAATSAAPAQATTPSAAAATTPSTPSAAPSPSTSSATAPTETQTSTAAPVVTSTAPVAPETASPSASGQ